MAKIITVIQQKGGSTKTTTGMNLAGALIEAGYKVKVADMNTAQQSASKWAKRGEDFQSVVVTISDKQTRKDIEEISKDVDIVIIDTPPELMTSALKAALLSDLLIIPCPASQLDLEAAEETVDFAETARKPFWLLASDIDARTSLGKKFRDDVLLKLGRTFKTVIHHKVNIVEAAMVGQWVGSYAPNSDAHIEYKELMTEILATKELA
jgi:chromosome partitioning protein